MDGGYPRAARYLSPEVIASDIAESLDRLGVSTIDLYFLHRDDPRVPAGEVIDLLNEQVALGRIGALGASNWTTRRIAEANDYAARTGKRGFVANQAKFSLGIPNPSKDPTVPPFTREDFNWHAAQQICVCAYSPTANGFFATNGTKNAKGWENSATLARLSEANRIAAGMKITPNQVALAWLLHQPFPVIPILGTMNVEHLIEALGASQVRWSWEDLRAIDFT
jgi:aryl-alcohol dehydrogenase-like predicted oxidoreductase